MRVISGKYKSRIINHVSNDSTRPTTDKVKGAIFNIIGPYFDGGTMLDLFSGSGAIAIEAISRGMDKAYLVDISNDAIRVINSNLTSLGIKEAVVLKMDYESALNRLKDVKFDFIFLDPPYKMHIIEKILRFIYEKKMLKSDGVIVCEIEKNYQIEQSFFEVVKEYTYSIRKVIVYKEMDL